MQFVVTLCLFHYLKYYVRMNVDKFGDQFKNLTVTCEQLTRACTQYAN